KPQDELLSDAREEDIVVPVMGTSGAGRSTFINSYLNKDVAQASDDLKSCTLALKPFPTPYPQDRRRRLVLVDTPGFNGTYHSDTEILQRMTKWLESSYGPRKTCGGIIYLHEITDISSIRGKTLNQIPEFQRLCGKKNLKSVVFATTKSETLSLEALTKRNDNLRKTYLNSWMKEEARFFNLHDSPASAQDLVNMVL
ncbi:hypothetical protein K443DRAFT_72941, partial [Laccaria amethystina LaAM-08-1]